MSGWPDSDALGAPALAHERSQLALWTRRVDEVLERAGREGVPRRALQPLEALRHKRDRVEVKLEQLARAGAAAAPGRRDLDAAWRELHEAWTNAILRLFEPGTSASAR